MKYLVMVVILLCCSGAAGADIIEWQDADGVRHYTNLKGEVPKEQAASTRVVVDEVARQPAGTSDAAGESRPAPQSIEPRREAEVVYDRSQLSEAYLRGLRRGLETAGIVAGGGGGGGVRINGPLAIANAARPAPYYDQYYPGYYPLLTTSFDRGRSRHLTLRLLLQDQFAIDRAAPFVFEERLVPPFGYPPLGVDLNPFLPRGLPHGFPQETRVIVR
jgi:uncharacterized protein DUF4124